MSDRRAAAILFEITDPGITDDGLDKAIRERLNVWPGARVARVEVHSDPDAIFDDGEDDRIASPDALNQVAHEYATMLGDVADALIEFFRGELPSETAERMAPALVAAIARRGYLIEKIEEGPS